MTQPLGEGASQGATIRRDVRDASEATGAALDSVLFIAREALTPAQAASLAGVVCHLRKALAGLDTLATGLDTQLTREPDGQGGAPCA